MSRWIGELQTKFLSGSPTGGQAPQVDLQAPSCSHNEPSFASFTEQSVAQLLDRRIVRLPAYQGSAAVMLAHALGAKTVFTASGDRRIERVRELGGTVGVDYRTIRRRGTAIGGLATISDFFGRAWRGWWLYFVAPLLAMPAAAFLYQGTARRVYCAKLFHYNHRRCIFRCEFPALLAEERTRGR